MTVEEFYKFLKGTDFITKWITPIILVYIIPIWVTVMNDFYVIHMVDGILIGKSYFFS